MSQEKNAEYVIEALSQIKESIYRIKVEVLEGGKLPSKKNPTDAGFDVFAAEDVEILPGEIVKVPLNIRLELPTGTWAEITSKSGLGSKGLLVYAGVIDEEYRGIPHVIATNLKHVEKFIDENGNPYYLTNHQPIKIAKGEKIAQLIMNPYSPHFYIEQVDAVNMDTQRGEGGFGSTGAT